LSSEIHSLVTLNPWKELLISIEEDVDWWPEPICAFLVKQNLSRSCSEWNPALIKSYHSYCIDYANPGTLPLEKLFIQDAGQQVPLTF